MSPASSGGTLEVEKYIGACLITQQRPKTTNREVFYSRIPEVYPGGYYDRFRVQRCQAVDRWAGGMPLISFANHQKNIAHKEDHNPLARLAVHTQGAPLILTKSFNRRNKNQKKGFDKKSKSVENGGGVDTVSVTSDESSGSTNSDNCLPRIIKPRKRRKKDRKPSIGRPNQDDFSTDSASPDIDTVPILRTYTPFIFDPHVYGLVPEPLTKSTTEDKEETPQLHHSFEDVEELEDVDINGNQTVCQCRYCDPSGQIWDVDRNCYSPFLTTPRKTFNFDTFLSNHSSSASTVEHCLVHSMSSVSLEDKIESSKNVSLEVSTEIVTSLNGHRDIEIKFFSSSSVDSVRALPKGPDRILNDKLSCESVNNECKSEE